MNRKLIKKNDDCWLLIIEHKYLKCLDINPKTDFISYELIDHQLHITKSNKKTFLTKNSNSHQNND